MSLFGARIRPIDIAIQQSVNRHCEVARRDHTEQNASQFLPALIGFNVGVELGQLAVIAAAYLGVRLWFGRHPKYRGRVAIPASVTIAMIGGYWFVERVFL